MKLFGITTFTGVCSDISNITLSVGKKSPCKYVAPGFSGRHGVKVSIPVGSGWVKDAKLAHFNCYWQYTLCNVC